MKIKYPLLLSLLSILLLTVGCSVKSYKIVRNINSDYLSSAENPTLKVPPGLKIMEESDEFAIPGSASNVKLKKAPSVKPPGE